MRVAKAFPPFISGVHVHSPAHPRSQPAVLVLADGSVFKGTSIGAEGHSAGEVVFKNLYEDLLLQSRADQLNITASEQEVDASVLQMRENFNITSDEQFRGALAQSGMTEQDLRENLKNGKRTRLLAVERSDLNRPRDIVLFFQHSQQTVRSRIDHCHKASPVGVGIEDSVLHARTFLAHTLTDGMVRLIFKHFFHQLKCKLGSFFNSQNRMLRDIHRHLPDIGTHPAPRIGFLIETDRKQLCMKDLVCQQ